MPKLAAELGISLDCLLSEAADIENANKTSGESQIENQNKHSVITKLFTIIGLYEIVSLLIVLSRSILTKGDYLTAEKILTATGVIQAIAWILLIVICFCLYFRHKTQESDRASLLIAIWIASFFIIGIYRVLLRLVFIGTLNSETNNLLFQVNQAATILIEATKLVKYIALCICAFVSCKILGIEKIKKATVIFITVALLSLLAQIVAIYLGKSYGITADISVLTLAYAVYISFVFRIESR